MNNFIKFPLIISLMLTAAFHASHLHSAVFVKYDGVDGEAMGPDGSNDWFVADSFSFGIEREMKESGEKGGTEDINIGVGELQECTISKSMDLSSAKLAQAAANGKTLGRCEVCMATAGDTGQLPSCYLHFVMERCYVQRWDIESGDEDRPVEEVAIYYNKIAFGYVDTDADGSVRSESMGWDNEKDKSWSEGESEALDFPLEPPPPR